MTAHTPAPKVSGVSALLASLSTVPLPPPPTVKKDFSAVMSQALAEGPDSAAIPPSPPTAAQKPSPAPTPVPESISADLLLALLAPVLPKPGAPKSSALTLSDAPSPSTAPEKPTSTAPTADLTAASLLLALLAPPLVTLNVTRLPSHKPSAPPGPVVLSVATVPPAPAEIASQAKGDKPEPTQKTLPQLAEALAAKDPTSAPQPTSGTSAANPSPRMSFLSERNEIAGRTEQKVPPVAISAVNNADTGSLTSDSGHKPSLAFAWHDSPSEPLAIIELSATTAASAAPVTDGILNAPVRSTSAAPLERLEQMISREAVSIRQVGAQSLGVTLKLDSNTQLFLQMTTHNGVVQASVRCERGNFAPEDAQWTQLQQSLARQNVELLPMTGGSNLNFQKPSEQRSRQQAAREDWPVPTVSAPFTPPRKQEQKEQGRSRKNWETWA